MKTSLFPVLILTALASAAVAETVKDREGAVRSDRAAMEKSDRWIYNDAERGFTEAAKTGKPLLVVLRCVPCVACSGIDASILRDAELQPLLDQFTCVRVINANALDLSRFQFDYDLSFSTLFFNADGTVYGRYGSWQHQRDARDATTAGYQAALRAVLTVHRGYPANRAALAPKQGGPAPFKVPVEIPSLAVKYERELNWNGKVVQSCVHCHQIGDAFRAWYREQGKPIPTELIYPMPAPETVGFSLDPRATANVTEVVPDSPGARAGLRSGDEIVSVGGAPVISIADVAWALHRMPDAGVLKLEVRRANAIVPVDLPLDAGWRLKTDISTRVGTWQMRAMGLGGLKLQDVPGDKRAALGLPAGSMALEVVGLGGGDGPYGLAKKAGFQKGDILTAVDEFSANVDESQLLGRVMTKYAPKTRLKTSVRRGAERVELLLPVQ
jgi:hypothetical protein